MADQDRKDDAYWQQKLSPEEFKICREKATERAFSGIYCDCKDNGVYRCRCCGEVLFSSETKYDSGSGWPSFYQPYAEGLIKEERDTSLGMERIEIMCLKCGCHLGHRFPDGPAPTGQRYCVNSASLSFDAQ